MKIPALKKFDQISDKARENIYALVMKHYQKHPNSPWSGRYLVELENSIKKFYQEMGVQYQGAFRDTLPDMMKEFYDRAKEEIRTAGTYKAIKGEPDAKRIKYFLDNSFEQVAMRTDKMSFDHIRSLRQLSAEVFREMSITGHTRREVSKALFERAMKIPGFEFTDEAGSKWQAKSYFKMLARTELMNASRECYDDKMSEEGFDVMRLTVSGDPCDSCSRYENRLFSLTGATKGLPTKADLEAAGVFHPNCTHTYVLVPDFIRLRYYNPDGTKKKQTEFRDYSDAPKKSLKKLEKDYKDLFYSRTTNSERFAINAYTGPEYEDINAYARNIALNTRANLYSQYFDEQYIDYTINKISSGLNKVKCQEGIKVYRGVHQITGILPFEGYNAQSISDLIMQLIANGKNNLYFRGFTSTSVSKYVAKNYGPVQFEINVPAGTGGGYIKGISKNASEYEFLLDQNLRYQITGMRFDKTTGVDYITVDILEDQE